MVKKNNAIIYFKKITMTLINMSKIKEENIKN